jgi:hypothetical protein
MTEVTFGAAEQVKMVSISPLPLDREAGESGIGRLLRAEKQDETSGHLLLLVGWRLRIRGREEGGDHMSPLPRH